MLRLASAVLLAPLASGCTVVLDPGAVQCNTTADCTPHISPASCVANVCQKVQCNTAADCAAIGISPATCVANMCQKSDPMWGCIGHVPVPMPDPTKMVTITETLVLATDGSPVTDVTCDVCDKLDLNCTGTNPGFPKGLHTDAMGNVTASVAQGFEGFVRITGPSTMDSLVFIGHPLLTPPSVKVIQLLKPADYKLLATVAGQTVDMTRGTAILEGIDCQGNPEAGISFQSANADSQTVLFYLIGKLPQEPPMATATDSDGFGGFFNLPVGNAVGKSYKNGGSVYIGESSFNVVANTISYVLIAPSPS